MLNIKELETQWIKYKIKSYIPHIVIIVSIIVIGILVNMILNLDHSPLLEPNIEKQPQILIIKKEENTTVPIKKQTLVPIITKNEDIPLIKLEPSLNFIKNMQDSTLPYYQNDPIKSVQKHPKKQTKKKPVRVKTHIQKVEPQKINIQRKETKDDIKNVIARFQKSNNPALSLFIAKKYYEIFNYKQAYNYALITNQINAQIEDSWLIFTKSLVKLGKKKMAMKTLEEYIQNSHSNNAQLLLNEIKSGKFR